MQEFSNYLYNILIDEKILLLSTKYGFEFYGTYLFIISKLITKEKKIISFKELDTLQKQYNLNNNIIQIIFDNKLLIKKNNYIYNKFLKEFFNIKKEKFRPPLDDFRQPLDDFRQPLDNFRQPLDNFRPNYINNNNDVDDIATPSISNSNGDYEQNLINADNPLDDFRPPLDDFRPPLDDFRPPLDDFRPPLDNFRQPLDEVKIRGKTLNLINSNTCKNNDLDLIYNMNKNIHKNKNKNNSEFIKKNEFDFFKIKENFYNYILKKLEKLLIDENIDISNNIMLPEIIAKKYYSFIKNFNKINNKYAYINKIAKDLTNIIQETNYKENLQKENKNNQYIAKIVEFSSKENYTKFLNNVEKLSSKLTYKEVNGND